MSLATLGMGRWLGRQTTSIGLEIYAGCALDLDASGLEICAPEDITGHSDGPRWFWLLGIKAWKLRVLEQTVTRLEAVKAGLGQTALYWLYQRTPFHFYFTPASVRSLASHFYWSGAQTMAEWREYQELSDEEVADDDGYFGPDAFDRHFPSWVVHPAPVLSEKALAIVAKGEGEAAAVARAISACIRQKISRSWPSHAGCSNDCAELGVILRWSMEDPVFRVLDDFSEYVYLSDTGSEWTGIAAAPLDARAFRRWKRQAEQDFQALAAVHRLCILISEEPQVETVSNGAAAG